MWREVDLVVCQMRNMKNPKTLAAMRSGVPANTTPGTMDPNGNFGDGEGLDMDVWCDIKLNNAIYGQTSTKKVIGSELWNEGFIFADLPPFDNLQIVLRREKRTSRPIDLGSVTIALENYEKGEYVEGWYPILIAGAGGRDTQLGELRLKLKVSEYVRPLLLRDTS